MTDPVAWIITLLVVMVFTIVVNVLNERDPEVGPVPIWVPVLLWFFFSLVYNIAYFLLGVIS